jgi:hypothetical protein
MTTPSSQAPLGANSIELWFLMDEMLTWPLAKYYAHTLLVPSGTVAAILVEDNSDKLTLEWDVHCGTSREC